MELLTEEFSIRQKIDSKRKTIKYSNTTTYMKEKLLNEEAQFIKNEERRKIILSEFRRLSPYPYPSANIIILPYLNQTMLKGAQER
ncbi:hypothetical protein NPIL_9921 [Nephila pilipes]|uniref:Uncharacterized protein n=1 Tax=Nephila pilipes TaxID=299642 RepID=A0A8X6QNR0_NEPPI|nr:hypothetical protein NPIL_9921 [Nephila pilipes]